MAVLYAGSVIVSDEIMLVDVCPDLDLQAESYATPDVCDSRFILEKSATGIRLLLSFGDALYTER